MTCGGTLVPCSGPWAAAASVTFLMVVKAARIHTLPNVNIVVAGQPDDDTEGAPRPSSSLRQLVPALFVPISPATRNQMFPLVSVVAAVPDVALRPVRIGTGRRRWIGLGNAASHQRGRQTGRGKHQFFFHRASTFLSGD